MKHALLFLAPQPVPADEIAETLTVARSNVSTSLRELQGWGIVRVAHILGDRRDRFESLKDVWEMFRIIVDERKKREIDPVLGMLRETASDAKKPGAADGYTRERLGDMLQFNAGLAMNQEHLFDVIQQAAKQHYFHVRLAGPDRFPAPLQTSRREFLLQCLAQRFEHRIELGRNRLADGGADDGKQRVGQHLRMRLHRHFQRFFHHVAGLFLLVDFTAVTNRRALREIERVLVAVVPRPERFFSGSRTQFFALKHIEKPRRLGKSRARIRGEPAVRVMHGEVPRRRAAH